MIKLPDGSVIHEINPDAKYIMIINAPNSAMERYLENIQEFISRDAGPGFFLVSNSEVQILNLEEVNQLKIQKEVKDENSNDVLEQPTVPPQHP